MLTIDRLYFVFSLGILKAAMDNVYISAIYAWKGYPPVDSNHGLQAIGIAITLLVGLIAPIKLTKPSDLSLLLMGVVLVLPMTTIYTFGLHSHSYMLMAAFCYLIILKISNLRTLNLPRISDGRKLIAIFIAFTVLIVMVHLLSTGGINNFLSFELYRIYEIREVVTESSYTGLFAYLIPWTYKIFIPFFIAWSLVKRDYKWLLISLIIQASMFILTTHKFAIAIGLVVLLSKPIHKVKHPSVGIALALSLSIALSWLAYSTFEEYGITSTLTQRPIFKPALLNFLYFEFFSSNNHIYLSNSILSSFIEYPYQQAPGFVIGEYFKGFPPPRSNTGFLGLSYAHFGFIGMLAFSILVGLVLWIGNSASGSRLPVWFTSAVLFGPYASMLITADFFPSMLTQGVAVAIFCVWFMSSKNSRQLT